MQAAKCRLCGDRHWGMCPKFQTSRGGAREDQATEAGRKARKPVDRSETGRPASGGTARKAPIAGTKQRGKAHAPVPASVAAPTKRSRPGGRKLREAFTGDDGKFDRATYRRQYMRDYRAKKAKGQKP